MTQFSIALMILSLALDWSVQVYPDAGAGCTKQVFQKFVPGSRDAFAASIHVRCANMASQISTQDKHGACVYQIACSAVSRSPRTGGPERHPKEYMYNTAA